MMHSEHDANLALAREHAPQLPSIPREPAPFALLCDACHVYERTLREERKRITQGVF